MDRCKLTLHGADETYGDLIQRCNAALTLTTRTIGEVMKMGGTLQPRSVMQDLIHGPYHMDR